MQLHAPLEEADGSVPRPGLFLQLPCCLRPPALQALAHASLPPGDPPDCPSRSNTADVLHMLSFPGFLAQVHGQNPPPAGKHLEARDSTLLFPSVCRAWQTFAK